MNSRILTWARLLMVVFTTAVVSERALAEGDNVLLQTTTVQASKIQQLTNRRGEQTVNTLKIQGVLSANTVMAQLAVGQSAKNSYGLMRINNIEAAGSALAGATIVEYYAVRKTSNRAGLLKVNSFEAYGSPVYGSVFLGFKSRSLENNFWPLTINTYVY